MWRGRLASSSDTRHRLLELLSSDELQRARGYKFDLHRDQYILARGLLRVILSIYTDGPADQLAFAYTQYGKPFLANCGIHFNVSHSDELALYAIAHEQRLGVDIERMRPVRDQEALAKQFFSRAEYKDWLALHPFSRTEGFFNCWTRKEAYLKAIGNGLSARLDTFDVSLTPRAVAAINAIDGQSRPASKWSLFHLNPEHDYVGAIAVYGRKWQLRHMLWSEDLSSQHSVHPDIGLLLAG